MQGIYDFDSPRLNHVSFPALDLMRQLLIVKDRYRMTSDECAASHWVMGTARGRRSSSIDTGPMRTEFVRSRWKRTVERVMMVKKK